MPDDIACGSSCDQRYLHDICIAVQKGSVTTSLAERNPGRLNHARWITLANRLLRLYLLSEHPSDSLQRLTSFIVYHYAPRWFRIKFRPHCTDGLKNLFYQTQLTAMLSSINRDSGIGHFQKCIFCSPRDALISMLADEDKETRTPAVDIIAKCSGSQIQDRTPLDVSQFPSSILRQHISRMSYSGLTH